jgi:hypothetical protein
VPESPSGHSGDPGGPALAIRNASHVAPAVIAATEQVSDDEILTPICSTMSYRARLAGAR